MEGGQFLGVDDLLPKLLMYAIQLLVFAFFALKPLKIGTTLLLGASIASAAAQIVAVTAASLYPEASLSAYMAGSILFGFQRGLTVVCWCALMCRLSYGDTQTNTALGIGLGSAFCLILISLGGAVAQVAAALLPILSAVLYIRNRGAAKPTFAPTSESEYQARTVIPESLLLSILIVATANGYMHGQGALGSFSSSVLVFAAAVACCTLISKSKALASPYVFAMISCAGGMMFMSSFAIGCSFISIGQICLTVIAWVVCVALQKKENKDSSTICGKIWAAFILG